MSVVISLVPHPGRMQRLRAAVRDGQELVTCDGWPQLLSACDEHPAHVVVVDLDMLPGGDFDGVRALRQRCPRVALVAYTVLASERVRHIFDAGRYGFEELVIADLDDGPSAFARALERGAARAVASLLADGLPPARNPVAHDALMVAVTRAHERLTPAALARVLATPPRHLTRALAASRYPPPHRLMMWGRLIVAAAMLDDNRRSAERIAATLNFPSGSAFRNNCRRYLKATPTDIRQRGGPSFVLHQLALEIAGRTAAAEASGPVVPKCSTLQPGASS